MPTSPFRRSRVVSSVAIALASLAACRSPAPEPVYVPPIVERVEGPPQRVLTAIATAAWARGWRVSDQGPDYVVVDFGTAPATLTLSDEGGANDPPRETEVRATGLYRVTSEPPGSKVALWNETAYWHPDRRAWVPASPDLSPGRDLIGR